MLSSYTNYLVNFFKVAYESCKEFEGRVKEVNFSLKKEEHFGKIYLRNYLSIELDDGKFVYIPHEDSYLSYYITSSEKREYMLYVKDVEEAENDMNHLYYFLKYFMPNIKVNTIGLIN